MARSAETRGRGWRVAGVVEVQVGSVPRQGRRCGKSIIEREVIRRRMDDDGWEVGWRR